MTDTDLALAGGKSRTVETVRASLDLIGDPCSVANGVPMGIHEMGLVRSVELHDEGNLVINLRLTAPTCHMVGYFSVEAKRLALQVPGVRSVEVHSDTGLDWTPDMMSEDAKRRRREKLLARGIGPQNAVRWDSPDSPDNGTQVKYPE